MPRRTQRRTRRQRRRGGAATCPPGTIRRSGYTRRTPSGHNVHVSASCITDVGTPGKWRNTHPGETGIGKLREGDLTKFGYDPDFDTKTRREALKKAVLKYGATSVFRKLLAVANYTVHTDPVRHAIYLADRDWVRTSYMTM